VETAGYLPFLMRDGRRILPLRRADLRHEVRQLDLRWIPGKKRLAFKEFLLGLRKIPGKIRLAFKEFLLTHDGFQVKKGWILKNSCWAYERFLVK
jgi:hypothetical protein